MHNYFRKTAYWILRNGVGLNPFASKVLVVSPDKIRWLGVDCKELYNQLAKRGIRYSDFYVNYNDFDNSQNIEYREHYFYKKVNISKAIEYSVSVELEIMPHEFDPSDQNHLQCWNRWISIAVSMTEVLYNLFDKEKPNLILYIQGYILETSIARQIAVIKSINTLALELTFDSQKIVWDNISGISVNKTLARNYFWRFYDTIRTNELSGFDNHSLLNRIFNSKVHDHRSDNKKLIISHEKKIVLFLAQVFTDSSSMFGIRKDFIDQAKLIMNLVEYANKAGFVLIVKFHPKEHTGDDPVLFKPINNLTYRRLQMENGFKQALSTDIILDWTNSYSTSQLMDISDCVVTINSQAGLEAAVMKKPVILCGEAFYSGLGFTIDVHNEEELYRNLNNVMQGNLRRFANAEDFINIYLNHYCIGKPSFYLARKIKEIL